MLSPFDVCVEHTAIKLAGGAAIASGGEAGCGYTRAIGRPCRVAGLIFSRAIDQSDQRLAGGVATDVVEHDIDRAVRREPDPQVRPDWMPRRLGIAHVEHRCRELAFIERGQEIARGGMRTRAPRAPARPRGAMRQTDRDRECLRGVREWQPTHTRMSVRARKAGNSDSPAKHPTRSCAATDSSPRTQNRTRRASRARGARARRNPARRLDGSLPVARRSFAIARGAAARNSRAGQWSSSTPGTYSTMPTTMPGSIMSTMGNEAGSAKRSN